ncbi:MAG: hypothetical protein NC937_02455 [Candidatus Omnitrophica bacterium]|nr:hypothetical protein [Candidatus Omnitrophota bacterium]
MTLLPAPPENNFAFFISTYYQECKNRFGKIEAIAGKWEFEDLIPGLSDFDSRYICSDQMGAQDWCDMSMIVGNVHLELCKRFPQWIRILEHLPGINITWQELTGENTYYPEYKQWSFYHTSNERNHISAKTHIELRKWDLKDEYFHLKKFLTYYGPYDRNIDVPINLGRFIVKYPLHSRVMHYFNPPIQSAVSIITKGTVRGKKESFRLAQKLFPHCAIFGEMLDLVDRHYEEPSLYQENALSFLESRMFETLKELLKEILENISLVPDAKNKTDRQLKEVLRNLQTEKNLVIFENAKFARLMKGRLFFYINAPDYFDSVYLIRNEMRRIGRNFFIAPFSIFWELKTGERIQDPSTILNELDDVLTKDEIDCTLKFARLTKLDYENKEMEIARQIIDIYDGFYSALHKITELVKKSG